MSIARTWIGKTLALCALLTLAPTAATAGTLPPECAGVLIYFRETLASQGFLGVLTPKADGELVKQAFMENIDTQTWKRDYYAHPKPWLEAQLSLPHDARFGYTFEQIIAMDFRIKQVCERARARGVSELTVVCVGDTFMDERSDDFVSAECFMGPGRGSDSDLRKNAWGKPATINDPTGRTVSRHDRLESAEYRRSLYFGLIQKTLNSATY